MEGEIKKLLPDGVLKTGFLEKRGGNVKSWNKRLFTLDKYSLCYFKCGTNDPQPIREIVLCAASAVRMENAWHARDNSKSFSDFAGRFGVKMTTSNKFLFSIQSKRKGDDRSYLIAAKSASDRNDWVQKLREVIDERMQVEGSNKPKLGEVKLRVWYDVGTSVLHVYVLEGRELAVVDLFGNPYAKMLLLPDPSKKTKQKTAIAKKTLEPVWNTGFEYEVSLADLNFKVLHVEVWDYNAGQSNDFIGEVDIVLAKAPRGHDNNSTMWYELQPKEDRHSCGGVPKRRGSSFMELAERESTFVFRGGGGNVGSMPSISEQASQAPVSPAPLSRRRGAVQVEKDAEMSRISPKLMKLLCEKKQEKPPLTGLLDVIANKLRRIRTQSWGGLDDGDRRSEILGNGQGALKVCVWFDAEAEKLKVEILYAKGLPQMDNWEIRLGLGRKYDPYVVVRLLPDAAMKTKYKTKVVKNSNEPVFNESFAYECLEEEIGFKTLSLSLMDSNLLEYDDFIGEGLIPLLNISRQKWGATKYLPLREKQSMVMEIRTLEDVLCLEKGYESFLDYLKKECSTENLLFWKEVHDFRLRFAGMDYLDRPECMAVCCEIFNRYMGKAAMLEINIPAQCLRGAENSLLAEKQSADSDRGCEGLSDIFDVSQNVVLRLMSRDSFARYKNSEEYAFFKAYCESEENDLGYQVRLMLPGASSKGHDEAEENDQGFQGRILLENSNAIT